MKLLYAVILSLTINICAEPLQLHPENPHYFLHEGKPVILIGSGEHYGAVLNLDFDYDVYLQAMENDGQNLTRLFTGSYVEKPGAFGIKHNTLAPAENRFQPPWARSEIPGYANGGNKFDLDRWNPDYFTRLKDFISKADRHGIVVEVVMFSSIYTDDNWQLNPFHPENNINGITLSERKKCHTLDNGKILSYQEKMVRKIVRELNSFNNVYFEIQNEPWPDQPNPAGVILEHLLDDELPTPWQNDVVLAGKPSLDWQAKIAEVIVDEEKSLAGKHLIAQNYCNFMCPLKEVDENISILNFHYAVPQCVDVNMGWNLPVAFDESGFAGPDTEVYRRQAWRFILSGGAVFNGLDYSFYPGFENGTGELSGPGGGGTELRQNLAVLRQFTGRFDLPKLRPDKTTVIHHPGLFVYLLSEPGQQYAGYLEGPGEGLLKLNIPAGDYLVSWINARTGELISKDTLNHGAGSAELKTPCFEGEIALEIRRK